MQDLSTAAFAGTQHLGRRDAFGELQIAFDDQRTPQRDGEQHAQQSAEAGDQGNPKIAKALPAAHDDECRQGKDHAGCQRFARGGRGLDDVVFEDGVFTT